MVDNCRVEIKNVSKSFRGVQALRNVSFDVRPGEIHALVGENGAGKSTLMKILSGVYKNDTGSVFFEGNELKNLTPRTSRQLGIGIIYQEFSLVPDLSVAENIFINRLGDSGIIHWKELYAQAGELIAKLGFNIDPRTQVGKLSIAYQQVVEIAKELSNNVKVLILDEPTSVLAPKDVDSLFSVLFKLKQQGVSLIYISHRLKEIFRIADRITVMKDGSVVGTTLPSQVSNDKIISMMIGRTLTTMYPKRNVEIGEEVFRIEEIRAGTRVKNVSLSIRAGEVLGIAGLVGSGRTEAMRAVFGADSLQGGKIYLRNQEISIHSPYDAVHIGIGMLPESRKEHGVILSLPIRHNITMASLKKVTTVLGVIRQKTEKKITKSYIKQLRILTSRWDAAVADLSGGNQQKVAIAKWLNTDCEILIMDEPTRGVDVGAKVEIYEIINKLAAKGLAIIVISSEILEILGICDRVVVMHSGEVVDILDQDQMSEEEIMHLEIGNKNPDVKP